MHVHIAIWLQYSYAWCCRCSCIRRFLLVASVLVAHMNFYPRTRILSFLLLVLPRVTEPPNQVLPSTVPGVHTCMASGVGTCTRTLQ